MGDVPKAAVALHCPSWMDAVKRHCPVLPTQNESEVFCQLVTCPMAVAACARVSWTKFGWVIVVSEILVPQGHKFFTAYRG